MKKIKRTYNPPAFFFGTIGSGTMTLVCGMLALTSNNSIKNIDEEIALKNHLEDKVSIEYLESEKEDHKQGIWSSGIFGTIGLGLGLYCGLTYKYNE